MDDLTEILNLLPKQIKGIHYSPKVSNLNSKFQLLSNWKDLLSIIEKVDARSEVLHPYLILKFLNLKN